MGDKTTILIEKKTRERLKSIKITKLETYDEILNRLLDEHQKQEK